MSHRIIISRAIAGVFADGTVREQMTPEQCTCVDSILQNEEPSPQDFRELTHRLNRIYAKDD